MKQFLRYILTLVAILMTTTPAWAISNAKVIVISEPTEGGQVAINSSNSATDWGTNKEKQQDGKWYEAYKDFTFYRFASAASGYTFKGWATSATSNSVATDSKFTVTGGGSGTETYTYYAIFATLQNATGTPSFSDTKVDEYTSSTINIKHAHAGTVTLTLTEGDFSFSQNTYTYTTTFSSTSADTKTITIYFKPRCNGIRTATLSFASNNGLNSIPSSINLSANGLRHDPNSISWVEPINTEMFIGDTRTVNVNATTDGNITYTSSNNSIISVSGNTLTANAEGTVTITATQAATCKYNAVSITKTFNVSDKKTPTFWLNGDPDQLTDNLKTYDIRTINITNVDESMTADYNPNLLSYTFDGNTATIQALDAGTATLTLTQPETSQIFFGERTFTFNITKYDTNTLTNDLATEYMVEDIIPEADIYTINNNEVPVQIISGNESILKFENGQLKAVGAGTTTLTVKQPATNKWVERTATKTITVHKYDITASINPDNAVWNQLVTPNPFSASTQHKFSGATSAVTDFTVTQQGNEHIALMDANTRNIQTYFNDGTVKFLVSRQEDYKYNELLEELELIVEHDKNGCYAFNDNTKAFNLTKNSKTSQTIQLDGVGNILTFYYKINSGTDWVQYDHHVTTQYSDDGTNFNDISNSRVSTNTKTNTKSHEIQVPQTAKYIRFVWSANGTGGRDIYVSNITVTRAQYIRPTDAGQPLNSTNALVLPPVAINLPRSKPFNLEWSACSDIKITCDNPKFTISTTDISAVSGSQNITITCNTSEIGTFIGDVTIYNQEQKETFPVICEVYTKWLTDSISGSATHSMKVDEPWNTDFYFPIQRASKYPTTNGAFHYAIAHTFKDENPADRNPNYPNKVISYNNGVITAHNAGTAILTIKHDETDEHFESQQFTCTLTVSKHDVERIWNDPVYFNDTIDNYFTTSNIASAIDIESQTDTDVARLTNEFNPTSNNSLDLITFNKEASTTVIVSQAKTYYWNGYSEQHIITPIDPNNHVTFTLTQENYISAFKHSFVDPAANDQSKGPDWQSGGIYFGGEGAFEGAEGWNWDEKYFIIQFTGIPDSIYFDASRSGSATGTIKLSVSEGKTPDNLTEVWSNSNNSENNKIIRKLNPDSRYLKFSYTGNLWGLFKNITVTELNEFRAVNQNNDTQDVTHLDFGANQVFTDKTLPFKLRYANPGYKITVESTDPHFTVDPSYIGDIGGEYHGTRTINVTYTSSEPYATSSNAMIIIKDELGEEHSDTVYLSASSYKAEQVIHWRNDFEAIPQPIIRLKNGEITDAAWATSYLPVAFTSNNPNVIKISDDGKTLIPVAEGEAEITAYQLGNETWLPADPITKTFIVTEKLLQYIIWNDDLTNIIKEDITPQTLPLTAQVYLQQEDGTVVISQEQTNQLTYQSGNSNIVSVSGNTLTINNVGNTTLTATVEGNNDYATASMTKTVIVRSATPGCDDNLLYHHEGDPIQFFQYNLDEIIKEPIALDRNKGEAGYVVVSHYGQSWNLAIQYYAAEIRVEQSLDNCSTWNTIETIQPVKNQENVITIPLNRQATHIHFVRNYGGQGYQFLYNIDVHPAQYIEAQDVVDFGEIHVGSRETRTFPLHYSNIKHSLSPVPSTSEVTATPNTFGECSGFGTQDISVTWLPTQVSDNATATITFTDPNSGMEKVVTLVAKVTTGTQNIIWDNRPTIIEDCGSILFPEKTTANLPITWTVIQGNEYADFNEQGMLEIYKNGTIVVEATQEGTANYEPLTPVQYTFDIQIQTIFVGTEDSDWHNPNNWTMCRLPYPTEVVTMEHPATLSTHATVAGVIFSTNGSIHITHTGGLTINEAGVTNAATDGSSIIIDNNPQGAGFLLISPSAPEANKYPYFTMNFTTRAFNEGVPRDETWQYMGAPGNNATFKNLDSQTLIYHWDETKGWTPYTVNGSLPTWQGYALTQSIQANQTYQITAQAIQGTKAIDLTYTSLGMKGDNLFVNSFTAPIDIAKFTTGDITGNWGYQTFYFFNTGSWNDWQGTNPNHTHDASSAGHYYAVPLFSAPYLEGSQTIVPPMQGVYVHTEEAPVSITLNYEKHVWNGSAGNLPMRAPQKQSPDFQRVRIQVSSDNSGADRMYIIQEPSTTRDYDNGYDGKNINAQGQVNIYTNEPFGKMEVSCANNIDSMYIGLRTGNDTHYTLTFGAIAGDSLYLQDLENDSIIPLFNDEQYHFTAQPNTVNNSRFLLLSHPRFAPNTSTPTTDINGDTLAKIWSIGSTIYIANAPANSWATLYTVSGHLVLSTPIANTQSPATLDVSHLPQGVYILRLNNQVYKFVCK